MHMCAVGRVGATPAVGRVARTRFARLRVLGEGAAELIHEAWDDAIWRTRAAGPRVGRAGQGCRRGCRAGEVHRWVQTAELPGHIPTDAADRGCVWLVQGP
eukprot:scaffold103006_cov66-Phaeocystis_antarctica.AAC.5